MKKAKKLYQVFALCIMLMVAFCEPAFAAEGTADSTFDTVLDLITKFVKIGGGLWAVWGAVVLGGALKDHNGPQMQSGIWQIVGGGVIIGAAALFGSILS